MHTFRRLVGYLRPYLGQMIGGSLLLAVAGVLMTLVVAMLKPLVNEVLMPTSPSTARETSSSGPEIVDKVRSWLPAVDWTQWLQERAFVEVPVLLIAIFLVRGILLYFGQYLVTRSGACVIRDIRATLYEAITYQSLSFFRGHPSGVVVSRILNDVQRLKRLSTDTLANMVRVGAMFPFMLVVVFVHDWRTSVFALLVLPLMAYPTLRLGRRVKRAARRSQERMSGLAGLVNSMVGGIKVVQGFAMERFEIRQFRTTLERMLGADLKQARAAALAPPVVELIGAVAGAALLVFAGRQIAAGALDAGDFTVVLAGLGFLFTSVRRLNQSNVELQEALSAAERIFQMMDHPLEVRDDPDAGGLPRFRREIQFDGVDFAYEDEKVLQGVDLVIRKGETVALVGVSGSGKTTIANLVCRFHDPTSGTISIDGHDLRRVTLASLRDQIGLVTQETVIFDDTVRANIAYGRVDVAEERVVSAAQAANAHEFIERLPHGYDTVLGEHGMRLSMGQRQRVTIARALLKDPPILILDEATSALDSESETLVQKALDRLLHGRTSIIIAHRLATVQKAQRIIVLDAGRVVEEGSHRELLEREGLYARLHALQFREPEEMPGVAARPRKVRRLG